ncbi:NAD(P)-binding domain-containing protein [Candidatus Gracilibacteria bacterium]|nr:NAD(P)-binding domain-containing protein [Candidatus Gracilibacteria bacterium]NJM89567.1 NAD(P)-binding domain-containing protein [Hydrococcus sp. RU_2_2]NJP19786.1 NAD(P)-binding domain-containing protein [Hydrococcus sp. CRU_1_1]
MKTFETLDVVIVGAGAAGIGCGVVLRDLGITNYVILERDRVGASFLNWPAEMCFITPSFPSHGFGLLDLNAITLKSSPALMVQREHLTGKEYAFYLQTIAEHFQLPIRTEIEVKNLKSLPQERGFIITTSEGEIQSRFVIWAAGEFQYPNRNPFPGAQLCLHNSQVQSWKQLEGDEFYIIGGYESGIDAAINLSLLGKKVRVIDRASKWLSTDPDPSISLSPYTLQRLEFLYKTGRIELIHDVAVEEVKRVKKGYAIQSKSDRWISPTVPILGTGFTGSLGLIADLFDFSNGYALLTDKDESTISPGLFLVGSQVRHGNVIFCFIYKFRQRFAVVANAIAQRLAINTSVLEAYRQAGLFLEDLSCCENDCVC